MTIGPYRRFGLPNLRTSELSDQWTFGLLNLRTIASNVRINKPHFIFGLMNPLFYGKFVRSDYRTFGLLNLRTIGPSDYWTFGLLNLRTIEPSDERTFGLSGGHHWVYFALNTSAWFILPANTNATNNLLLFTCVQLLQNFRCGNSTLTWKFDLHSQYAPCSTCLVNQLCLLLQLTIHNNIINIVLEAQIATMHLENQKLVVP